MSAIDSMRRPEYTGTNRCWPCTLLNLALLGAAVVVLGLISPPLAFSLAAVGTAGIWVRGYLVPYTPSFAPRIADWLPVEFTHPSGGDRPVPTGSGGALAGSDPSDPEAVLETLLDSGILETDEDGVFLSQSFEATWDSECATLADLSSQELAAVAADAAPGDLEVAVHEVDGGQWIQLGTGGSVADEDEVLLSRPVAVAEVAAVRALTDAEVALDTETRASAAQALRAFLDNCPVCGTRLVESSTADCCGGQKADARPVSRCPNCDEAIYTFPET